MPRFESELYQIPDLKRETIKVAKSPEDAELIIRAANELASIGIVARQFPQTEEGLAWAENFVTNRHRLYSYPIAGWQVGHVAVLGEAAARAATFPVTQAFEHDLPVFRITATEEPRLPSFDVRLHELRTEA
jgi:hypothetical protein